MVSTVTGVSREEHRTEFTVWRRLALIVDMIVDPAAAAPLAGEGPAWLLPWALCGACIFWVSVGMTPFTQEALRASLPPGTEAAQAQKMLAAATSYQTIGAYLSPLFLLLKWVLESATVFVSCVLFDIRITFQKLLNLISHCALLLVIQDVMTYLVLRLRAEPIRSASDLVVTFGLDLLLRPKNPAAAVLHYFSPLNLWFLAACALAVASTGKTSRLRGAAAMAPLVVLQLIFTAGLAFLQPA